MDVGIVYPDSDLSLSATLGNVFHIPTAATDDDGSEYSDELKKQKTHPRPRSVKEETLDLPSRWLPTRAKGIRPFSAVATKTNMEYQHHCKLSRQPQWRPHLKAPTRSPSMSSIGSSLITAVGLANKNILSPEEVARMQTASHLALPHVQDKANEPDKWAVKIAESVSGKSNEPENHDMAGLTKRTLKKHPSFETWLEGSPQDSDEYDTDLDIEEYVKSNVKEEKPIDPTGRMIYVNQCQTQGLIPVSYIQRHLGDKNLRMRHHYFGGNGAKPLAMAFLKNTITETLDISDNYLETEGARYISTMMRNNTFITHLNISNNSIGNEGFAAICKMLETNTTLKSLSVSGNHLPDSSAQYLVEGLKCNSSLICLDLSDNCFGEKAGSYIGGALSLNEGLQSLDISWNSIRNRGAAALLSCLVKNITLEVLDLSWNGIGSVGAQSLKLGLKNNKTLRVLDLTNNQLNTKAAETVAWGLARNVALETLVLNLNLIKDGGLEAILKAVEKHPLMKLLSLEGISISSQNYNQIQGLQASKDVSILFEHIGGYQRNATTAGLIHLFDKFVCSNQAQLGMAFNQYDNNRNGFLSCDEIKMAVKDAGLRLTDRQISAVLDELSNYGSYSMSYRDILNGNTLKKYFRRHPANVVDLKTNQTDANKMSNAMEKQLRVI